MFLLKKIVNTQLRGLLIKMAVNITQLTKTIITDPMSHFTSIHKKNRKIITQNQTK